MATARGYILETEETNTGHISKIAVQHGKDQTEEELRLIVENGGEIIDVIVEHPLYGELTGTLHIKTPQDIDSFMRRYQKAMLLYYPNSQEESICIRSDTQKSIC